MRLSQYVAQNVPISGVGIGSAAVSRVAAGTDERRASVVLVVAVLLVDSWVALRHPSLHGDTSGLVVGAQKIVDCVHHRVFTHCDTWVGDRTVSRSGVGPWPLLQYMPAVVMRSLGFSHDATLRVLIVGNALALWALFGLVWITLRRTGATAWAPLLIVALLASPLLWYGTTAFGDALAAAVVVAAIAAVLLRGRPVLVGALVALAGTTKETNVLFVVVLAVICVLAQGVNRPEDRAASRRLLVAVVIGTIVGGAANTAFNIFRFGSVRNTIYLQPYERAPNAAVVARAFVGQWVAPNGGLLWFWPCALSIVVLTVAGAVWTLRRSGRNWTTVAPILVASMLVVDVLGLATWYSPFGWLAWGPRLMLPLLPAMLLISCVFASDRATYVLHRFMAGPWLWPAGFIVAAIGLPEAVVLFHAQVISQFFSAPDPHCVKNAHAAQNPHAYYRCFDFTAWQKRPFLLQRGLEGLGVIGGWLIALVFVGAVVMILKTGRTKAQRALNIQDITPSSPPHPATDPIPSTHH
jgi:hypothetical protein